MPIESETKQLLFSYKHSEVCTLFLGHPVVYYKLNFAHSCHSDEGITRNVNKKSRAKLLVPCFPIDNKAFT